MKLQQLNVISGGCPQQVDEVPKTLRNYWSMRDFISMENGILMEGDCMHQTKIEVGCAWPSQYEGYLGITLRELDRANMKATWESL